MENDIVLGNRNTVISQTMNKLFIPLAESDSGSLLCNQLLMIDDDLPTLGQLASQISSTRSFQTSSIPHKQHVSETSISNESIRHKSKQLLRLNRITSDTEELSSNDDDDNNSTDSSISMEDAMDQNAEDDINEDSDEDFRYATEGRIDCMISFLNYLI